MTEEEKQAQREKRAAKNQADLQKYAEIRKDLPAWKPREDNKDKDKGYHRKILRQARVGISLPPVDIADSAQVEARINEYLDFCESADKMPNMVGMASWLGVSPRTMSDWKNGARRANTHTQMLERYLVALEDTIVEKMMDNKVNPANAIFILKNHYQYRDQTDHIIHANTQDEREVSAEDIAKRYLADPNTIEQTFEDEPKAGDS